MAPASLASEFPNDNAEISGGAIWICRELTGPATLQAPAFEPVAAVPFVFWFDDDAPFCEGPVEIEASSLGLNVTVHVANSADTEDTEDSHDGARDDGARDDDARDDDARDDGESERRAAVAAELDACQETPPVDAELPDAEPPPVVEAAAEAPVAPAFAHFERALSATLLAQGASRSAAILPKILRLETLAADALSKDVQLTLQSRGYLDGSGRYSAKYRDLCLAWSAVLRGSSQDFGACGTTTLDRFGADLLAALLAVPATRSDELRRELRKAGVAAFGILEAA